MHSNTIRGRLQRRLLQMFVGLMTVSIGGLYFLTHSELSDALRSQMYQMTATVAGLNGDEVALDLEAVRDVVENHDDYMIAIVEDGRVVEQSFEEFNVPADLAIGEHVIMINGLDWRLLVTENTKRTRRFIIGRMENEADELIWQMVGLAAAPTAIVFVLAVVVVISLLRNGLAPLTALSGALGRRSPDRLDHIDAESQPGELQPIVASLNGLFDRIAYFLRRERRFIDDAAHELRTPLTVIKAQCQAIDQEQLDDETRQRLKNILEGIDRAADLSNQLLHQARAERPGAEIETVKLEPIFQKVLISLDQTAVEAGVILELNVAPSHEVLANPGDIELILRNLVENAIHYGGRPGRAVVTCLDKGDFVQVAVEDNGPGIAKEHAQRVFERFWRANPGKGEGSGLGLSIVQALSSRNAIAVGVKDSRLGGAKFTLKIPKP